MSKLLYPEPSYEIRGVCFWVWKEFGSAFKESVYHKALALELVKRGISFESEKKIPIYYRGIKVGTYIPDFVVAGKIIVEVKVVPLFAQEHRLQFWRYLKGSEYRLGFLINFGGRKLEIIRKIYDKTRSPHRSA